MGLTMYRYKYTYKSHGSKKMGIEFHVCLVYFWVVFLGWGGFVVRDAGCQMPCQQRKVRLRDFMSSDMRSYTSAADCWASQGVGRRPKGPGPSGEKTHPLGKLTNWLAKCLLALCSESRCWFSQFDKYFFQMGWLVQPTREMDGGSVMKNLGMKVSGEDDSFLRILPL